MEMGRKTLPCTCWVPRAAPHGFPPWPCVWGKGSLWETDRAWEGGRIFAFGWSLDSLAPAAEFARVMSVYVSGAREHTDAPIQPLSVVSPGASCSTSLNSEDNSDHLPPRAPARNGR